MSERFDIGPVHGLNLALSAGAVAASWMLASPRFASSVALGALLETLNFRALRRSCEHIFLTQTGAASARGAVGGFGFRFVLLGLAVGVALHQGASPVGLLIGLSMIVPSAIAAAVIARPPVVDAPAGPPPDDPSWDRWNPWLARERDEKADDDEDGDPA